MPRAEPTRTEAILQLIVGRTRVASPPPVWDFLKNVASVREMPDDVSPLIAALREEFTDEELEASGVFVSAADDELHLSPVLSSVAPIFMWCCACWESHVRRPLVLNK